MFISGFLGLLTAASQGAGTEYGGTGYYRQPISFCRPKNGVCHSAVPYNFGMTPSVPIVGRGIWDAPTGGNLLLVMPFPAGIVSNAGTPAPGVPFSVQRMPVDRGDVGHLRLAFAALTAYPDGDAYNSTFAAGSILGATSDGNDGPWGSGIVSGASGTVGGGIVPSGTVQQDNPQPGVLPVINLAVLSTASGITIARGILQASGTGQA